MLIDSLHHPDWNSLTERVRNLNRIAILTGAGISAESGLATFRSNGLWENHRVEDVATPEAFERDPKFVWRFYNMRREGVFKALPNDGHRALVELEAKSQSFAIITQNVDGLHQLAGSQNVIELHGSIRRVRCTECSKKFETHETLTDEP
ncbi:MAG TPA: Sir2 family NAD-dependent protein deacetylase, partial [Tepidisphaeraceae bacterium]|nr:Sir2 family NAD-dependent protein deacetylase [Tepidisphaeraceae bacterium]